LRRTESFFEGYAQHLGGESSAPTILVTLSRFSQTYRVSITT
jgi:hypothetical protein